MNPPELGRISRAIRAATAPVPDPSSMATNGASSSSRRSSMSEILFLNCNPNPNERVVILNDWNEFFSNLVDCERHLREIADLGRD
jgi:hypothetical protein